MVEICILDREGTRKRVENSEEMVDIFEIKRYGMDNMSKLEM